MAPEKTGQVCTLPSFRGDGCSFLVGKNVLEGAVGWHHLWLCCIMSDLVSILHINHSFLHISVINIVAVTTPFSYLSALSVNCFYFNP